MNKVLSFSKLDFLTIKPYLTMKNLLIFTVVSVFIGYGTGSSATIIGMLMMYSTFYVSYPFAVGDKNGIDVLYASLPITKFGIVAGRYIFALFFHVAVGIVAFAISAAVMILFQKDFSLFELMITTLLCFSLYTVLQAIQLPMFFKMGYTKAKLLAYLPLAGFPAVVIAASSIFGEESWLPILQNAFMWIEANSMISVVLAILLWIGVITISLMTSYRFYLKREF